MSSSSHACCNLPPVQAEYTNKGSWTTMNGLKTYAVGPEDAKSAVLFVYDVFGYSPQILQGADLIASQGHRVLMPDVLKGEYATPDMFAPGGEEKKTKFFSQFPGSVQSQSKPLDDLFAALKTQGFQKIAAFGFCWGYKAIVVSEGIDKLDAILGAHPTFPAPEDGDSINVPVCLFPTSGEDMSVINKIQEKVDAKMPGKNVVKHYPDEVHGFMAARGDLSGGKSTDAYAEAYQIAAKFLKDIF
ncbi:hypothetical protein IAU60_001029 [Kwoniella sp. DSM 27419]